MPPQAAAARPTVFPGNLAFACVRVHAGTQLLRDLRLSEESHLLNNRPGLGVVELTTAIHYVFNTPEDKLVWDVGHQCYPHKILTGRRARMTTIRQKDGLSGFTKRSESPYDPFGAGHSSTSISAALGFAMARELGGVCDTGAGDAIAVIGDGAMSAGMAYEAMNNAGHLGKRLIVILNDNEMSIAPPTGAMSSYLSRLYAEAPFQDLKAAAKGAVSLLPPPFREGAKRAKEVLKTMTIGGTLFEELGFDYIGPIDGHDLHHLLPILRTVKARATGPILIHAVTTKGKGYAPAEGSPDKGHARAKFDVATGEQKKAPSNAPAYTKVFARELTRIASEDSRVCAVTAAMPVLVASTVLCQPAATFLPSSRFLSSSFAAVTLSRVADATLPHSEPTAPSTSPPPPPPPPAL